MTNYYHRRREFDEIIGRVSFNQHTAEDVERLKDIFNRYFLSYQTLANVKRVIDGRGLEGYKG